MSEEYRFNSYEEAMEAVRNYWWELKYVRPDLQTPELALGSVKEWGLNLKFVPAHCQTQEVIEVALKSEPDAKSFIKIKGIFKNALEEALDE